VVAADTLLTRKPGAGPKEAPYALQSLQTRFGILFLLEHLPKAGGSEQTSRLVDQEMCKLRKIQVSLPVQRAGGYRATPQVQTLWNSVCEQ
jgi:hypothetical protein